MACLEAWPRPAEGPGEARVALEDALSRLRTTSAPGAKASGCALVQAEPEGHNAGRILQQGPVSAREPSRMEAARGRSEAARSICMLGQGAAEHADSLVFACEDPEQDVRWAAVEGLGRAGPAVALQAGSALASALEARAPQLRHVGPQAPPDAGAFAAGPRDGEWEVRRASALALRRLVGAGGGAAAAPHAVGLAAAMHDRSPSVRAGAAAALEALGPEAVGQLVAAVGRKDKPRLRRSAAHALSMLGPGVAGREAEAVLCEKRSQETRQVRQAVAEAHEVLSHATGFGSTGPPCTRCAVLPQAALETNWDAEGRPGRAIACDELERRAVRNMPPPCGASRAVVEHASLLRQVRRVEPPPHSGAAAPGFVARSALAAAP